jgi:hypothetical protein
MLFPILVDLRANATGMHHHHMAAMATSAYTRLAPLQDAAIVLVHTGAMLLVMGTIAFAVYEWIGLKILRSAWINLDALWAGALIAAGALSFVI